jgi:hypothetical protein
MRQLYVSCVQKFVRLVLKNAQPIITASVWHVLKPAKNALKPAGNAVTKIFNP